jgi:preprotein translocase subunit SecF
VIAALAIPTSLIATFGLMAAMGFTLNQITMLALTLMVGIVIDDAIVVLENIFRFIEEKGMPPFQAAIEGTKEIGLAVMATTLVAAGGVSAGRFHGRHRRPLHVVVWFDVFVRDRGFAAGFVHADADAGGAS